MVTKVDIYMPTYKPNAEYLHAAIDSIFAQTEQNWHLYIQDEPTDINTKMLIQKYLKDNRVSFVQNKKRLGIGKNWNACLQNGSAQYIQYMFQDDLWKPHFLESAMQALDTHTNVGIVSLEHEYKFEKDAPHLQIYKNIKHIQSTLKKEEIKSNQAMLWLMKHGMRNVIGEPCFVMLRRNIVHKAGVFHETMQQGLDIEYWIRVIAISHWYFLPGNYGYFRVHNEGASAQNLFNRHGMFDRITNFYHAIQLLPTKKKAIGWMLLIKIIPSMIIKFFFLFLRRK